MASGSELFRRQCELWSFIEEGCGRGGISQLRGPSGNKREKRVEEQDAETALICKTFRAERLTRCGPYHCS